MDLARLNSATKYPSIPTFHALGEKGRIAPDAQPVDFGEELVVVTEKVDGTNGRIIIMPDGDWFIGSREELLTARGDRIANPALGIVETLRPWATSHELFGSKAARDTVVVVYAEVYGHKVTGAAKHYTASGKRGARMFDVASVPLSVLDKSPAEIAAWRDAGGQDFASEVVLDMMAHSRAVVPRLSAPSLFPRMTPAETRAWLGQFFATKVALDEGLAGGSEGVVVRTLSRSKIAKIRFDDYRKVG